MANRREDAKNEKTIRTLLKLPDNRRCINCNSLGPQYVCTNFWTFVCTTCSGIHREFTHRVKSVSMAKFTSQEVSALQGGGNASAKEIYFKDWDPQRQSSPDGSNVEKLRDFIKHVYVDRRYSGERSFDKPPREKAGNAEDASETRRTDNYQGGSRSPPYEDTYDRRYSDRPSPGGRSDDRSSKNSYDERRSPGYEQESRQYSDYRKSPARTEIVNDWRREDRFGNGRRSEETRNSDGSSRLEARSPDSQSDLDITSPPIVRPVRDILGENVSPLRVIIEPPPKANSGRSADGSIRTQRTASSSSLASSNGNPAELRSESSLIDFDAVPEPPSTANLPPTQVSAPAPSVAQQKAPSNDNWANFDSFSEVKVSPAPSNVNLFDSLLSELSVPAPAPAPAPAPSNAAASLMPSASNPLAAPAGPIPMSPFGSSAPAVAPLSNQLPAQTFTSFGNSIDGAQWQNVQPRQHFLPTNGNQLPTQPLPQAVGPLSNQPWNASPNPNPNPNPNNQLAFAASAPLSQVTSGAEVRPTVKQELPQDLFTTSYSSYPVPNPGWYSAPQHGMGYNPQYNMLAPMPSFPPSLKSSNPFDVQNEPPLAQVTKFPSMGSLQGALPDVAAPTSGLLRTSSLGTPQQTWMPPRPSHPLGMPPQAPSYAPTLPQQAPSYAPILPQQAPSYAPVLPPGSYMGQLPPNMPPRQQQGGVGFGFERDSFGPSLHPNQQHQTGLYSAPAAPNTFPSAGGNPFG